MRGLLPSVWLLGAALYTALTLFLSRPVAEDVWPLPPRVNETVIAKQPPKAAKLVFEDAAQVAAAPPAAEPQIERHNEWVQVADYTTVGRLHPSTVSPVLFAYSVGRPLRVIAREGGFVRVQDLGSGRLGWIKETSLAPFVGGYRLRDNGVAEPLVAAAEPEAVAAKPHETAVVIPVATKKVAQLVAQPQTATVAAIEPAARGLFRRKRDQVNRVAFGSEDTGVAAIMQRAFGRF
jgi:hypothetical protein